MVITVNSAYLERPRNGESNVIGIHNALKNTVQFIRQRASHVVTRSFTRRRWLSFARVFFNDSFARLALDKATPLKLAVASLRHFLLVSIVSSSTAQQIAAIYRRGRPSTAPALRAKRSGGWVEVAVVRGGLEIDEVFLCGSVESPVLLDEGGALLVETDLGGAVVAFLQTDTCFAEARQLVPAGLEAARSRHSVTLARHTSVLKDCLQTTTDHSSSIYPSTSPTAGAFIHLSFHPSFIPSIIQSIPSIIPYSIPSNILSIQSSVNHFVHTSFYHSFLPSLLPS